MPVQNKSPTICLRDRANVVILGSCADLRALPRYLSLAICLRDRALFVSETARMLPTGASSSAELAVSEAECKVNALA